MKSKLWTKAKTLLAAAGLLSCALFGVTAVRQLDEENVVPVYAEAAQEDALVETWNISETVNDSVTAKLYEYADKAGTYYLDISGTGAMKNFSSGMPWDNYCTAIDKVTMTDGVTSIGYYAFSGCSGLTRAGLGRD